MSPSHLEPELDNMWKEKTESEILTPEEDFIPAKLATHEPNEEVLVRITL